MSNAKRKTLEGRGPVGKFGRFDLAPRIGRSNQVAAKVVRNTDAETLQGFVLDHAAKGATVYTDDSTAYDSLPFKHAAVKHSVKEYVRRQAHTNGIVSIWSMLKRAHKGTFHKISPKHLNLVRSGVCRKTQHPRISNACRRCGTPLPALSVDRLLLRDLIRGQRPFLCGSVLQELRYAETGREPAFPESAPARSTIWVEKKLSC